MTAATRQIIVTVTYETPDDDPTIETMTEMIDAMVGVFRGTDLDVTIETHNERIVG